MCVCRMLACLTDGASIARSTQTLEAAPPVQTESPVQTRLATALIRI